MIRGALASLRDRPVERAMRLLAGLAVFGISLALIIKADLGLDPWDVFSQGVARRTGWTIGTVTIVTSVVLLLAWIPLKQRPGLGTVANAVLVGAIIDLGLLVLPAPGALLAQALYLVVGAAVGSGLYIGAGWGAGPRDGIMTGFAAKGVPLPLARGSIEVSALLIGWLLGGSVGVGTIVFALGIGPLVGILVPRLAIGATRY
jgi:uncharacterized membrane protein YczE